MNEKSSERFLIIEEGRIQKEYFKDLFRYYELFYFFAWRDVLVRYKQAFFGVAWALLRPLLNMVLFAFIFGYIAQLPSGDVPYTLFVLAGTLPWQLFSNSIVDNCGALVNTPQLMTKVYFPRMIVPAAQIIVYVVDFGISALLLLALSIGMGYFSIWTFWAFPFITLLLVLLCLGVGLWLSALTVQYRDFRFLVPFFVQFGMFLSPVGYGSFIIPGKFQWFYLLNPLVGIINGIRWSFFGMLTPDLGISLLVSVILTLGILFSGICYFRKMERTFADKI